MLWNPRATGLVLPIGIAALVLPLANCGHDRDSGPTEPTGSGGTPVQVEVGPPDAISGGHVGQPMSLSVPGDSSNEVCLASERCVIQGQTYENRRRVTCPSGVGNCGTGIYEWALLNPPPGSTVTFTPPETPMETWTQISIQTDSSTPPGVHQSVSRATQISGTAPGPVADAPYPIHVRCSFHYNRCPTIEIVDQQQPGLPVVSAPAPTQTTLIGKQMRLKAQHKPGSGSGTYTLNNKLWTISGGTSALAKSYNILTGTLSRLSSGDLNRDTVSYYYVVVNSGYTAKFTAKLTSGSQSYNASAMAKYDANGPTDVSINWTMIPQGPAVGSIGGDTSKTFLRLGQPFFSLDSVGMQFEFSATAPAGDNGYVAGTQLARSSTTIVPTPPEPIPTNTNGSYWLDGCELYDSPSVAAGGGYVWASNDSPSVRLLPIDSTVTRQDNFRMYFMYRPGGPNSIWVPIGQLNWSWNGTAIRTGGPGDNNHGWTGPTNAASGAGPAIIPSSTFPVWTSRTPATRPCDTPPTN